MMRRGFRLRTLMVAVAVAAYFCFVAVGYRNALEEHTEHAVSPGGVPGPTNMYRVRLDCFIYYVFPPAYIAYVLIIFGVLLRRKRAARSR